jgi:hypothetical protein
MSTQRFSLRSGRLLAGLAASLLGVFTPERGAAQLADVTQTPNAEGAGIQKSLAAQVGAGRGDVFTPDSSLFLIARDPFRSVRRGRQLFQRKFTSLQGLGPRKRGGLGDIQADAELGAGLADSCAGCHGRPRGSAGFGGDVFTRPDSRDAPHLFGLGLVEMLADEMTAALRATRAHALAEARALRRPVTRSLLAKGISFGRIRALPDGGLDTSQVEGVDPDLRVRPFFADGREFSIRAFTVGAFQAEMGLQAADPDLLFASSGGRVLTPSGLVLDGTLDRIAPPPARNPSVDPDGDGVSDEVPVSLVDHMEFYLLNYFKPGTYQQTPQSLKGLDRFVSIGCASCHVPTLTIEHDRRVADVETVYDPTRGIFNNLFATATALFSTVRDGSGFPERKVPQRGRFVVENFFSDLKRHDLGPAFWERQFDGSLHRLFVTEPLWGVASSAPYGHDGRSVNLEEVILRHGGEAQGARDAFAVLPVRGRQEILAFLNTLVLFPPDDTASNLDPGDRRNASFPQRGHGSIFLSVLFNNPGELE